MNTTTASNATSPAPPQPSSSSSYLPACNSEEVDEEDSYAVCEDSVSLSASSFSQSPDNPFYAKNNSSEVSAMNGSDSNVAVSSSNDQTTMKKRTSNSATATGSTLKRRGGDMQQITTTTAGGGGGGGGSSSDDGEDSDGALEDSYGMREMSDTPARTTTTTTTNTTRVVGGHHHRDHGSSTSGLPSDFHNSPEPIPKVGLSVIPGSPGSPSRQQQQQQQQQQRESDDSSAQEHRYHMLCQIQEDRVSPTNFDDELHIDNEETTTTRTSTSPPLSPISSPLRRTSGGGMPFQQQQQQQQQHYSYQRSQQQERNEDPSAYFVPHYTCTKIAYAISKRVFDKEDFAVATWMGFWALLNVTCANYVLTPLRDAVALHVGVQHIPKLTLASSLLAFLSSVPIGWLFEAPDPSRRKLWKKMGLTRGATQGTSLALFYRFFALSVLFYAVGFFLVDILQSNGGLEGIFGTNGTTTTTTTLEDGTTVTTTNTNIEIDFNEGGVAIVSSILALLWRAIPFWLTRLGQFMYVAFFLVVHLMKLHSISLVWGVTTEAMEYEDVARKQQQDAQRTTTTTSSNRSHGSSGQLTSMDSNGSSSSSATSASSKAPTTTTKTRTRYQRLALVGFGGTLGGVWGRYVVVVVVVVLTLYDPCLFRVVLA
jgi:hypothetical protein